MKNDNITVFNKKRNYAFCCGVQYHNAVWLVECVHMRSVFLWYNQIRMQFCCRNYHYQAKNYATYTAPIILY